MHIWMCVGRHIKIHVCTCIHMLYIGIYTHACMYAYVFMYKDMHKHILCVCMCRNACYLIIHMYVSIYVHVCIYSIWMYTLRYEYKHTYMSVYV